MILAGEIVSAGRLGRMQPITYQADASGTLAVLTTVADVPGATYTFTTAAANATYVVWGVYDVNQVATTNNDFIGRLSVDGVISGKFALFGGQVNGDRATVTQVWRGTLPSAGSHTIKLAASTTAVSQFQVVAGHTSITIEITEVA
jgi:uncharacterized protein YaiE (UPF0345 family)